MEQLPFKFQKRPFLDLGGPSIRPRVMGLDIDRVTLESNIEEVIRGKRRNDRWVES